MKTQVTFRSSKFPSYDGEEELINPGLWGKRLAEYLVQKLAERDIETHEMFAEDWGWYVPVRSEGFRLALCCGHQDGDADEFLCFTDPSTPIVKKFFKKIDATRELTRLTVASAHSCFRSRHSGRSMDRVKLMSPGPSVTLIVIALCRRTVGDQCATGSMNL